MRLCVEFSAARRIFHVLLAVFCADFFEPTAARIAVAHTAAVGMPFARSAIKNAGMMHSHLFLFSGHQMSWKGLAAGQFAHGGHPVLDAALSAAVATGILFDRTATVHRLLAASEGQLPGVKSTIISR